MAYRKLSKPLSCFYHVKACKEVKAGILHTWKQGGKNLYSASTTLSEGHRQTSFLLKKGPVSYAGRICREVYNGEQAANASTRSLALSNQTWFANSAVPLSSYMTYSKLLNHYEHKAWPVERAYKWQYWWSCHHYHPQETKNSGCKYLKECG